MIQEFCPPDYDRFVAQEAAIRALAAQWYIGDVRWGNVGWRGERPVFIDLGVWQSG